MTTPAGATAPPNPIDHLLRADRMPHIWCPGCGIGTVLKALLDAHRRVRAPRERPRRSSPASAAPRRVPGYVRLDSFHTTHGRALPYATGLHLANPRLKVVVVSGDGDLFAIGGNHFIHAARRNVDLLVVCVNNFTYGMTGGQAGPTTPTGHKSTTTPAGNLESPFNLPNLAAAAGAVYVARWTTLHARPLQATILEALGKPGFRFIEVIAPCPTAYGRRNKMGEALDMMKLFYEKSVIRHGANTQDVDIDLDSEAGRRPLPRPPAADARGAARHRAEGGGTGR